MTQLGQNCRWWARGSVQRQSRETSRLDSFMVLAYLPWQWGKEPALKEMPYGALLRAKPFWLSLGGRDLDVSKIWLSCLMPPASPVQSNDSDLECFSDLVLDGWLSINSHLWCIIEVSSFKLQRLINGTKTKQFIWNEWVLHIRKSCLGAQLGSMRVDFAIFFTQHYCVNRRDSSVYQ